MLWDLDDGKHLYTLDSSDPIHSQSHILSQQDQVIRNKQPCNLSNQNRKPSSDRPIRSNYMIFQVLIVCCSLISIKVWDQEIKNHDLRTEDLT